MGLLDDIFGPGFVAGVIGGPSVFANAERQHAAAVQRMMEANRAGGPFSCLGRPQPEPGITWTRTGGRTHRVEIVR